MPPLRRKIDLLWEEPFRIFFPAGLLIGLLGVALWPLFFLGLIDTYPSISHARLMVQGFLACFIFGFLGTAGPRVMSVQPFSRSEIFRLLLLLLAACVLHLRAFHALADGLFALTLIAFAISLGRRFRERQDSPPPNFALVGLGLANGLTGAILLTICEATGTAPNVHRIASSFLNIGFPLLPVLGVAPFFLRRLLDLPAEDDSTANQKRNGRAALAVGTGLAIDLSFVLEIYSATPAIGWVRFGMVAVFLGVALPLRGDSILAAGLRLSLAAIVSGLALLPVVPAYRTTALHVLFIGGFSLAVFSVATRVVLGHSGNLRLVRSRIVWLGLALLLFILAMVSRFVADFGPSRNEHLVWGAIAWIIGSTLWAAIVLPHVGRIEPEQDSSGR